MPLSTTDIAVLCGGKGTRVAGVLGDTPKCLAPINGRTFLDWLVDQLKSYGTKRIVLCAGHLGDKVRQWLDDRPHHREITLVIEPEQKGTAPALRGVRHLLTSPYVMIMNGDTIVDADLGEFLASITRYPLPAGTLFARRGQSSADSSGVYVVNQAVLDKLMKGTRRDLPLFMHKQAWGCGEMIQWRARYHDIGVSPASLAAAGAFLDSIASDRSKGRAA